MSDDYVSRKAVRDRVLSLSLKRFELSDAYKVYVEAIKNAGVEIARTPAADVAPVRHGYWIAKEDYNMDIYYECSICKETWTTIEGDPWDNGMNYCPHCGAKMDG